MVSLISRRVFAKAAQALINTGWARFTRGDHDLEEPMCMMGALDVGKGGDEYLSVGRVSDQIGLDSVTWFNDHEADGVEDVIGLLDQLSVEG